jgi:hypothetical protein
MGRDEIQYPAGKAIETLAICVLSEREVLYRIE